MTNQPNKATVKDGLPTPENILFKYVSTVNNLGGVLVAMQEYSGQQNAELTRQVAALTHQRDFYRKKFNESKGVHIAKDLGIPENIEMAPIVQSDSDALRERVKELEAALRKLRNDFLQPSEAEEIIHKALKK